jgi:hypothetical protein
MDISREVAKTAPPEDSPAPANVPEIVRIGAIPSNLMMDVDSDILEPVVSSQSFMRYVLDNKGLLHSNSKLVFSMKHETQGEYFFPLGVGVMALIERATLKVGTKTINSIDDWNAYQSYRSTFVSCENMKNRELVTTGRALAYDFEYNQTSDGNALKRRSTTTSNTHADKVMLDIGRYQEIRHTNTPVDGKPVITMNTRDCKLPDYMLLNASGGPPEFQINLSDLFPFLKMNQLPLYMMKEQVSIELRLTPHKTDGRMCCRQTTTANGDIEIDQTKSKLIADYIFYPTDVMEAYARQNQNMSFTYMDYFLSKQSFSSTFGTDTKQIRNIGGAGKIITKLIVGVSPLFSTDVNKEVSLLNNYNAVSCSGTGKSSGSLVSNVKYNGEFLYPIDRVNNALHFHDVSQAEGSLPFITRSEYCSELADDITESTFEGHVQATQLTSKFFRQAYRLNRHTRINTRGIELFHTYQSLDTGDFTQRCWVESVKMANLSNGILNCYDA